MPVPASDVVAFAWAADGKSILYARNEHLETGFEDLWLGPQSVEAGFPRSRLLARHKFRIARNPEQSGSPGSPLPLYRLSRY